MKIQLKTKEYKRRAGEERRAWPRFANKFTALWDWVDDRDIDKHIVSIVVLYGTVILTRWAIDFAGANPLRSGADVAMIIGAVTGPYALLQAAAIKFYFDVRK